jgi:O-antigen/teichoic acid export membrane protein
VEKKTDKRLAIEASLFTLFGFGISQIIRLANNMILTRLLIPEYFGIVSIGSVFILGINLFSDIGLTPSVIRSQHTDDEQFINTVWTIQIIRGFIIAVIAFLISFPVAHFYQEPKLKAIITVIGSLAIIQGFNSINLLLYRKNLQQGALAILDLVSQIFASGAGIAFAYYYRNVWALVVIHIIAKAITLFAGHFILKTPIKPRLLISRRYLNEILHFGKWIFFSTAMTFVAGQTDKILLGKLMSLKILGIFNIAIMFSELIKQVLDRLSGMVLFPLFSKYRDFPRSDYRKKIAKPRRMLLLFMVLLTALLTSFGDYIITLLYDDRYYSAAWMLPVLAIGMWPYALYVSNSNSLYVIGKPQYHLWGNMVKFIYMIIVIPLVFNIWGIFGVIIAIALNDIPTYIVMNMGFRKERISYLLDDFLLTVLLFCIIGLLLLLRISLNLGLPGAGYY